MGKVFTFTRPKGCTKDKDAIKLLCRVLRVAERYLEAVVASKGVKDTEVGADITSLLWCIDEVIKTSTEGQS